MKKILPAIPENEAPMAWCKNMRETKAEVYKATRFYSKVLSQHDSILANVK